MIDWENPFKAEDFEESRDEDGAYLSTCSAAEQANTRFREIVEKYGKRVWRPCKSAPYYDRENVFDGDTHSAILICEKKLEKE